MAWQMNFESQKHELSYAIAQIAVEEEPAYPAFHNWLLEKLRTVYYSPYPKSKPYLDVTIRPMTNDEKQVAYTRFYMYLFMFLSDEDVREFNETCMYKLETMGVRLYS